MPQAPSLIDEVHRRIGRNLLRFQEMEVCLKVILPYIHPEGSAQGLDARKTYHQQKMDGQTLGPVLKEFEESIAATPGFFDQTMGDLPKARDDLVHNFYKPLDVDLMHPDGVQQAITYLDRQFADAQEWAQLLRAHSLLALWALFETNPTLSAEYAPYHEKLLAQLPAGVE